MRKQLKLQELKSHGVDFDNKIIVKKQCKKDSVAKNLAILQNQ
jgi:hypothetical protein